jgi:site-specific DNA-methyltransferase (adenine-specific)
VFSALDMMGYRTLSTSFLNSIYGGDCIEVMDWLYNERGSCVDLVFADPPYNLVKSYEGYSDDRKDKEYIEWCNQWLLRCAKLLKPDGSLFILNLPKWTTHHAAFLNNHLYFQNWIVWDALSDPRGRIMPAHYGLLHYTKHATQFTLHNQGLVEPAMRCLRPRCIKTRKRNLRRENLTNIWHDIHRIKHKRDRDEHPCQLPEKLLQRVISLASNPGDVVFDPFMGTGTTAVVAKKMGRHYLGAEYDDSYIQIAKQRLATIDQLRPRSVRVLRDSEKVIQLSLSF